MSEAAKDFSTAEYARAIIARAANGNEAAEAFLHRVLEVVTVIDDLHDKDREVSDEDRHRAMFSMLSGWEGNPYAQQFFFALQALLTTGYNAWLDSIECKKSGGPDMRKYGRALACWIFEIIPYVAYTTGGYELMRQVSLDVRQLVIARGEMTVR